MNKHIYKVRFVTKFLYITIRTKKLCITFGKKTVQLLFQQRLQTNATRYEKIDHLHTKIKTHFFT